MARAAILVTGDEVLGGRVAERNAAYLARSLADDGIRVEQTIVVGDDPGELDAGLRLLLERGVDLVCTTGGLGPTVDDMTMAAVAEVAGRPMALHDEALRQVRARSRNVPRRYGVTDESLEAMRVKQATLPEGAVLLSPAGTAPGAIVSVAGVLVVVLPGPPWELQDMWARARNVAPLSNLLGASDGPATRTFRLWAVFEAELVDVLNTLGRADVDTIGTYTRDGELEIVAPNALSERVGALLHSAYGDALFATDGELVDDIVAERLIARRETLAVAESCTGGGLGGRLTASPGASEWFYGGVIAYANEVKQTLLGVPQEVIAVHGAVSGECAAAMAAGVRSATGATWGVSITGVAGPGGGSPEKPVGTVWIGLAGPEGIATFEHHLRGDRESVRRRAQSGALHHLREALAAPRTVSTIDTESAHT